ncbi:helix-turn-helix transcriptional regulator [Paraburkholderia sp. BL25I1N1]|uniref:helix-turn-helix transcriptional regulator n=1 Tax=Paraburkholderia sp. BL25I1N1 TaxID=1938804 RepID=UPI000D060672|nr:helix-turn-helix transcriptional regulator [Paraburkholderia sp. BL25I1N1]
MNTSALEQSAARARAVLAANLRSARAYRGLKQEQLGALVGLHRTYIGGLERGERNASIETLAKLAVALGCEVHELMDPNFMLR